MAKERVSLKEAVKFHGHLGPYLILGILAGEAALKRLRCGKYFGLNVKVRGADKKPESCFIDGLQLSSGATYGKGNILKLSGPQVLAEIQNEVNHKKISLKFTGRLIKKLEKPKTHRGSELLARQLYHTDYKRLFTIT